VAAEADWFLLDLKRDMFVAVVGCLEAEDLIGENVA
jgi:hypothetical protein